MDTKELSRDSSGTRAYAAFLLEMARCVPAVMLPSISVLLVLLDGEVSRCWDFEARHFLRNRVIGRCVYVLQMFFCFLLFVFFRLPQKYQTTVLGNG